MSDRSFYLEAGVDEGPNRESKATMALEFEFIDATRDDKFIRRLARSHAMKGKNAGRKLHRRSKLNPGRWPAGKQLPSSNSCMLPDVIDFGEDRSKNMSDRPDKTSETLTYTTLSDHRLLAFALPVEASPHSRYVINQFCEVAVEALYPPQLCRSLNTIRSYWFRTLLTDSTTFHCSLALMASLSAFFSGKSFLPPKAIYHLNQAVSLVNASLGTAEAVSDSNMAVVNFLVVQELVREDESRARVHLEGLQRMMELRGGLQQISHNSVLALKICKTDLDYALHYGTSTCFFRDRMSDVAQALLPGGFSVTKISYQFNNMDPFLRQILLDVVSVSSLFNQDCGQFRLEPNMLQELIVSVGYRLIRFHPLCALPLEEHLDSVCHIGLVAFVTTLFLQFGPRRYLKYGLVAHCVGKTIQRGLYPGNDDLMLWLLFVGGISVLQGVDQAWLATRIRHATRSLGIEDWEGVHRCLVRYPWINSIHNKAAKALWDSVTEGSYDDVEYVA